jgi:hypothetical protein
MSLKLFAADKFCTEFLKLVKENARVKSFQKILFNKIKEWFYKAYRNGQSIGDRITSTGSEKFEFYKSRISLPGSKKGKSSGLRVIHYVYDKSTYWLISIYSKKAEKEPDPKSYPFYIEDIEVHGLTLKPFELLEQ